MTNSFNPVCAVSVPHPPLIIPQIGRGQEKEIQATIDAYRRAAGFIAGHHPDTVIVITPHTVMYSDYNHISPGVAASGNFGRYRAKDVKIYAEYDAELIGAICAECADRDISAGTEGERDMSLDHGTMIPLWFMREACGGKLPFSVVRVGLSGLPLREHYRLGMAIKAAADKLGRRIAVIASGDLSHRLREDGPYGYNESGPVYDEMIMSALGSADFGALFGFKAKLCREAGECGHKSFTVMAGAFDGTAVKAEKLSYEGPFGVGYGVCTFEPVGYDDSRRFLDGEEKRGRDELAARRAAEDEYVRLARKSLETYIKDGRVIEIPDGIPSDLISRRAGAFVSLHKDGNLRGCIGTIYPVCLSLAQEIIDNAVSAGTRDPRFPPVKENELEDLEYSVDVLGDPEDIPDESQLDVRRYGVIVTSGYRRGLLLPNLDGVDTVQDQISIARQKAGIKDGEPIKLQRFEVVRHF